MDTNIRLLDANRHCLLPESILPESSDQLCLHNAGEVKDVADNPATVEKMRRDFAVVTLEILPSFLGSATARFVDGPTFESVRLHRMTNTSVDYWASPKMQSRDVGISKESTLDILCTNAKSTGHLKRVLETS